MLSVDGAVYPNPDTNQRCQVPETRKAYSMPNTDSAALLNKPEVLRGQDHKTGLATQLDLGDLYPIVGDMFDDRDFNLTCAKEISNAINKMQLSSKKVLLLVVASKDGSGHCSLGIVSGLSTRNVICWDTSSCLY